MNRLVYLFELDSVRNSPEDVAIGQKKIFNEIVKKGNIVVLTFNQLTDSIAFLAGMWNDKNRDNLLNLFELGVIRISRYGTTRTVSQYMQNSIEKALKGKFIFSNIGINKYKDLLMKMSEALKYNDPGIVDRKLATMTERFNLREREYISNYIRIIITLSQEKYIYNDIKTEKYYTFKDFVEKIICTKNMIAERFDKNTRTLFLTGIDIIENIYIDKKYHKEINNRSKWYLWLREYIAGKSEEAIKTAWALVDLCYNYAVENSILDVSKNYFELGDTTFMKDFASRFFEYYYSPHTFSWNDSCNRVMNTDSTICWRAVYRAVMKARKKKIGFSQNLKEITVNCKKHTIYRRFIERIIWSLEKVSAVFVYLLVYFISVGGCYIINECLECIQKKIKMPVVSGNMFNIVIVFGVFTFIISLLQIIIPMLNVFNNTIDLLTYLHDVPLNIVSSINIRRWYRKKNKKDVVMIAGEPEEKEEQVLNDYYKLMEERQAFFDNNAGLLAIEKDIERIEEYEQQTKNKIGVVYKGLNAIMIADLIKKNNGEYYIYERVMPVMEKKIVVMRTICNEKHILLKQYRHTLREFQYGYPRGISETMKSSKADVAKQLYKSIDCTIASINKIGEIAADSEIYGSKIDVYDCKVDKVNIIQGDESIVDYVELEDEQMEKWIYEGSITDVLTIAAYELGRV